MDFDDIAKLAVDIVGRTFTRVTISDEEYRTRRISHGVSELLDDGLEGLYRASRAREFAVIDPTLERLLGRSPTGMNELLTVFLG